MKPYTTKLRCFCFWRPETGSAGDFTHSLPGSCAIKFNMAGNVQFLDLTPSFTALLDILHVGKAIIQEVSRYNFAVDIGIAETLRSRCMYFTSALVIASQGAFRAQKCEDLRRRVSCLLA